MFLPRPSAVNQGIPAIHQAFGRFRLPPDDRTVIALSRTSAAVSNITDETGR